MVAANQDNTELLLGELRHLDNYYQIFRTKSSPESILRGIVPNPSTAKQAPQGMPFWTSSYWRNFPPLWGGEKKPVRNSQPPDSCKERAVDRVWAQGSQGRFRFQAMEELLSRDPRPGGWCGEVRVTVTGLRDTSLTPHALLSSNVGRTAKSVAERGCCLGQSVATFQVRSKPLPTLRCRPQS